MHYNQLSSIDRTFVDRIRQKARGIFSGDFTDEISPQQHDQIARVDHKWLPYAFCCPTVPSFFIDGNFELFDVNNCIQYSTPANAGGFPEFVHFHQMGCWIFAHTRLAALIFLCPDETVASFNSEELYNNLEEPLKQGMTRLNCKLDNFFDLIAAGGFEFMRAWIGVSGASFDGSRFIYVE
jgi:hypothetical protein